MPRQARLHSESGIHHVMLRGINRDVIFLEDADYHHFLNCVIAARDLSGCRVLAYCLMPNHVHLVLQTTSEPIGAVIKRLGVRYASWFNRKYGRVGHVFQDRFKSIPVEDDAYFVTVLRYVWRNPVDGGLAKRPDAYRWSSYSADARQPGVVDESALRRLLPDGAVAEVQAGTIRFGAETTRKMGRPKRHTDEAAAALLQRACGEGRAFTDLAPAKQHQVLAELRVRNLSYAQLARLTGVSVTQIRRLQMSPN